MLRIAVILAALLGLSAPALADEWWGAATPHSYHNDRHHGYNEHNYGLGLEYHADNGLRFIVGEYRNSFFRHSNYAGVAWMPLAAGDFHFGLIAGGVSGYIKTNNRAFKPMALPMVMWEYGNVGVNLLVVPTVVTALQVKWRF